MSKLAEFLRKFPKCLNFMSILITWKLTTCLIIIIVIIPKSNIYTKTRTQGIFGFVTLVHAIISQKQFCFLRKYSMMISFWANETTFTGIRTEESSSRCGPCSCGRRNKQPPFQCAWFQRYRNRSHRHSKPGHFYEVLTSTCPLPSLKGYECQVWSKSVHQFSSYKRTNITPTI